MTSYKVTDIRQCMNELLVKDTFDFFLLQEATVKTFAVFNIDGHRVDEFYSPEESETIEAEDFLVAYENLRSHIYDVIKGKKTPVGFQIILSLPKRIIRQIIESEELNFDADSVSLVIIFRYVSSELTITTGISFREFIMDKSLESAFDKWVYTFLNATGINVEII